MIDDEVCILFGAGFRENDGGASWVEYIVTCTESWFSKWGR